MMDWFQVKWAWKLVSCEVTYLLLKMYNTYYINLYHFK